MEWWSLIVLLTGIFKISSAARCDLTLQKDGNILQDGEHVLGIGGDLNQIYCKALCSGPGPTPALKWFHQPSRRPVRWFRGRVYQVKTTFERVSILTIRNMLYSDTGTYMCRGWVKDQGWIEKSFELVYGCKDSYHLCDTSKCLSEAYVCDGTAQCSDRTDEQQCKKCRENQFQCDSGACIDRNFICDRYHDCIDGSDEYNCGCKPDFECSPGECVSQHKVCDGTYDCSVGEDEVNCTYCEDNEFHCGNRYCIAAEHRCNGVDDCSDRSDEYECPIKVTIEKPRQEVFEGETIRFTCVATPNYGLNSHNLTWSRQEGVLSELAYSDENTLTITEVDKMDAGIYICVGSDGNNIDKAEAELIVNERCPESFECSNGTCISADSVCDLIENCPEGEDEYDCAYCAIDEYHCGGGKCIPDYQLCDNIKQCDNGSDESNCVAVCETYEFMCTDGSCINNTYICDHVNDCPSGDDEDNCSCYTDSFRCDHSQCIDKSAVCNGTSECMNGMDEENCEKEELCTGEFMCASKDQCVPIEWRCDGSPDCPDASDECGCAALEFTCVSGMCINNTRRCDGVPDCDGEEDEKDCGGMVCAEDQIPCPDESNCINKTQVCDNKTDCDDGWDEGDVCEKTAPDMNFNTDPEEKIVSEETDIEEEYYDEIINGLN